MIPQKNVYKQAMATILVYSQGPVYIENIFQSVNVFNVPTEICKR